MPPQLRSSSLFIKKIKKKGRLTDVLFPLMHWQKPTCISSSNNYSTTKPSIIHRWLLRHPRFHLHFTPTGSSWLNLVELASFPCSDHHRDNSPGKLPSVRQTSPPLRLTLLNTTKILNLFT